MDGRGHEEFVIFSIQEIQDNEHKSHGFHAFFVGPQRVLCMVLTSDFVIPNELT